MGRILFVILLLLPGGVYATPADDYVILGNSALQRMDVVAAMVAFTQALDENPKHAEAAYQRGRILLKINEPQKAIIDFTTAVLNNPSHGRALARRGEAKIVLKDWVAAFADFDAAVRMSPQDYEVFVVRATYRFKRGELGFAISDMESAIAVADPATAATLQAMLQRMK